MSDQVDLRDFGYARGDYAGGNCVDCHVRLCFTMKRAWRCRDCAIKARDERQAIIDCPLICDMPHL